MNKGREKRIAALNEAQEQRRLDCLDKTEKAIIKLSQTNQKLSFANIAREAKVSISYLYKYPEIKQRIQYLRKQQEDNAKPVKPQLRTEKSSQTIIHQLKNRIKTLDTDKKELTKQNEALTGRLYALGNNQDMIARLQTENSQLNNKIQQLKAELEVIKSELNQYQKQQSKTKVRPINQGQNLKRNDVIKSQSNVKKTENLETHEEIKSNLNPNKTNISETNEVIQSQLSVKKTQDLEASKGIKSNLNQKTNNSEIDKVLNSQLNVKKTNMSQKNEVIEAKIKTRKSPNLEISEIIKLELNSLGIKLNSTLRKLIKASSEQTVLNAIEALKEANSTGEVLKPGGWLATAIENGWTKNENELKQQQEKTVNYFTTPEKEQDEFVSLEELKQLGFILGE